MSNTTWRRLASTGFAVGLAAIALTIVHGAVAQTAEDADRDAIRAHIDRIFKAYIAKNRPEVQATHDREWRGFLTGSPSIIKGIDEYMRSADGSLKSSDGMQRYTMEQFDVQFRGDDIAIVPYVAGVTGRADGAERSFKLRVLDVYQRQNGEWMQVASNTALHPRTIGEQMSEPRQMSSGERAELLKVRDGVWYAWFGGDEAALRKVLPAETIVSDDKGWTTRDGTIKSSVEFAKTGGRLVKVEFPRTDIQSYGATAILYTTYAYEIESAGKRSSETGTALEVFVRRDSGWVHSGWQLRPDPKATPSN